MATFDDRHDADDPWGDPGPGDPGRGDSARGGGHHPVVDLATWRRGAAGSRPRIHLGAGLRRGPGGTATVTRFPSGDPSRAAHPAARRPPGAGRAGIDTWSPFGVDPASSVAIVIGAHLPLTTEPPFEGAGAIIIGSGPRRRPLVALARLHPPDAPVDPTDRLPYLRLLDDAGDLPGYRIEREPIFHGEIDANQHHGRLWLYQPCSDRGLPKITGIDADGATFHPRADRRFREGHRWERVDGGFRALLRGGFLTALDTWPGRPGLD